MRAKQMCTYHTIGAVTCQLSNPSLRLFVIEEHVRALLGEFVGVEFLVFAYAYVSDRSAVGPNDLVLGIPKMNKSILDAEAPTSSHGPVVVIDADRLPFGDAGVVIGLVASGTNAVIDAGQAQGGDGRSPVKRSLERLSKTTDDAFFRSGSARKEDRWRCEEKVWNLTS